MPSEIEGIFLYLYFKIVKFYSISRKGVTFEF